MKTFTRIVGKHVKNIEMAHRKTSFDVRQPIDNDFEAQETTKVDEKTMEALEIGRVYMTKTYNFYFQESR